MALTPGKIETNETQRSVLAWDGEFGGTRGTSELEDEGT